MGEIKHTPCKHLDYTEGKFLGCTLIDDGHGLRYWRRDNPPYELATVKVQFCQLRGRINSVSSCYGEQTCYETEAAS